jgi:hypothetical protein
MENTPWNSSFFSSNRTPVQFKIGIPPIWSKHQDTTSRFGECVHELGRSRCALRSCWIRRLIFYVVVFGRFVSPARDRPGRNHQDHQAIYRFHTIMSHVRFFQILFSRKATWHVHFYGRLSSSPSGPASQTNRKCCACPTSTPSPYSILMELSLLMRTRRPDPLLAWSLLVEALTVLWLSDTKTQETKGTPTNFIKKHIV